MGTVNVGLVGVGNCTSSLVQGVQHYARQGSEVVGLRQRVCAGYDVSDVRFTSAFDVNVAKIGRDLAEAIWVSPNNALRFCDVPSLGVVVCEGVLSDGIGQGTADLIPARGGATVEEIAAQLRVTETQVLVSFLPTGSQRASELYAEAAILAHCAFVNCMPATIARSAEWARRFEEAGVPVIGDDLKSQFGATLIHQALLEVLARNGVQLRNTYQIVSGGNMDFLNLQDAGRIKSKKATKVQGFGGATLAPANVHFGAEYVPFLGDRKVAFIRVEGHAFGGTPVELELRMAVEDSPSAAGNVLDAIRYLKRALDLGLAGVIDPLAALLMKAAPRALSDAEALAALQLLLGG